MYCWQCGAKNAATAKYCAACGAQLVSATPAPGAAPASPASPATPDVESVLWTGRPILSGFASLGTLYELTTQRIRTHRGVLGYHVDELELVRVKDVSVEQDMGDRVLDTGDVVLTTADQDTPILRLHNVADPHAVKELVRTAVRVERERRAGQFREIL